MGTYKDMDIFKQAYKLAKEIHFITKEFPGEELFSLTSQVRRSSRSVCANFIEACRKKHYPKHFRSKLSDADGECSETILWLMMAYDFNYLEKEKLQSLASGYQRVGQMIGAMIKDPGKFK